VLGVALAGLLLDAATKALALAHLDEDHPIPLLGGLVTLQLIHNPGAAFSIGTSITPFFAILGVVVLIVIGTFVRKVGHPGWAVALGLLIAGIAGNLVDRIIRQPGLMRGHVVDFLQLPHFAILNVADICITAAVVLIIVLSMIKNIGVDGRHYPRVSKKQPADD
jgi:signal peptidase II